jgi:hypothetical protein
MKLRSVLLNCAHACLLLVGYFCLSVVKFQIPNHLLQLKINLVVVLFIKSRLVPLILVLCTLPLISVLCTLPLISVLVCLAINSGVTYLALYFSARCN